MGKSPYGDFIPGEMGFRITTPDIPRNWYNYIWNDDYVAFVSQTGAGEGFLQDEMGRRIGLVAERGLYLLEGRNAWGISGLPVEQENDGFECVHTPGAVTIRTDKSGIRSSAAFFVPQEGACELWNVILENQSDSPRELKLVGACGTAVDGRYTRQGYNLLAARYDDGLNGMVCRHHSDLHGQKNGTVFSFFALSERADSWEGTMNRITGPYGSFAHPWFVKNGGLTGTDGNSEKLGFALQKNLTLAPGERTALTFVCGTAFSREEAEALRSSYLRQEDVLAQLEAVRERFEAQIGGVKIRTPDEELDRLFPWCAHQANLGSRWARVRHNGFRDMASDTECLAAVNPRLALARFLRILTFQYANGYAPRTILDGEVRDNQFADNTVWLTFTAYAILMETGNVEFLEEQAAFNDGTGASVYEHLRRSVDFLYHFRGRDGLIRIWGGDWNDCMNEAGLKGEGVSVWLSMAWYRANRMLGEIAGILGRTGDEALCGERGEELRELIERYGWDGEYYLTAISDDGTPIGSRANEEGKIFLNPQLWAVLSGVAGEDRQALAMDAVRKYLSCPLGTAISAPAYTRYDNRIGSVTLKPPGVHENGGVYLHTIAWKIAADAVCKRPDEVERDLECILPFRNRIVDGRAEPYVLCNSYFGEQTGYRYGTPGQSWRTAAGPWLEKALVNYVFGLKPRMEGLSVECCLPPSWESASVTKLFRGATYHIEYDNKGPEVAEILVDGERIRGNILPWEEKKEYHVRVVTGGDIL